MNSVPLGGDFEFSGDSVPGNQFDVSGNLWDIKRYDISGYIDTASPEIIIDHQHSNDFLAIVVVAIDTPAGAVVEPGLEDWIIYVDSNGNNSRDEGELYTATGIDGSWEFSGLAPGTYVIREELQPGWIQTSPVEEEYTVTLSAGDVVAGCLLYTSPSPRDA